MSVRLEIYHAFSESNVISNKFLTLRELKYIASIYFKAPIELRLNSDALNLNKELTLFTLCNCYNCSGRKFFPQKSFLMRKNF